MWVFLVQLTCSLFRVWMMGQLLQQYGVDSLLSISLLLLVYNPNHWRFVTDTQLYLDNTLYLLACSWAPILLLNSYLNNYTNAS